MRFLPRRNNSRTIIGVILLIILLVLLSPNILPSILSDNLEFIDAGVPCANLRQAENLAEHQSWIARQSDDPISLSVQSSALPAVEGQTLIIRLTVINNSIGTIPIIYNPDQVPLRDDNANGLGLVFPNPLIRQATPVNRQATNVIPESDVKLLGPRQRCVHRFEFTLNQLNQNVFNNAQVSAYYRVNPGVQINSSVQPNRVIFPDSGMAIPNNLVESPTIQIPAPVVPAQTG